jgi:hypothetical protein
MAKRGGGLLEHFGTRRGAEHRVVRADRRKERTECPGDRRLSFVRRARCRESNKVASRALGGFLLRNSGRPGVVREVRRDRECHDEKADEERHSSQ